MDATKDRVPEGGRVDATKDRNKISNNGGEGGWMTQRAEMNYRTVAEGGRMDDTTCRNELSNSGRGREDG